MTKIIFTGGPCRGKTEVKDALSDLGFNGVQEVARPIINAYIQEYGKEAWDKLEFCTKQEMILDAQLKAEKTLRGGEIYFLDRGIPDCGGYSMYGRLSGKITDKDEIKRALEFEKKIIELSRDRYDLAFLLNPMPHYTNDEERRESKEQAAEIHEKIRQFYSKCGYDLIEVPWLGGNDEVPPVKDHIKRAGFIISTTMKNLSIVEKDKAIKKLDELLSWFLNKNKFWRNLFNNH